MEPLEPCAAWSDDCQGKKDYDGRLLSISTRYWPGPGGGTMTYDTATKAFGSLPYGPRPSATASIVINHGEPDQYGYKAQVEAWVKGKVNAIVAVLRAAAL